MAQFEHVFEMQVTKDVRLPYLLHLPSGYEAASSRRWPLVLFLHGAGERGDDLELVRKHGIAKVVEEQQDLPFLALSPQCSQDTWWSDHVEPVMALLDEITAIYRVNADRVYLTGLSMGGFGAWHLGTLFPERFAAVVPICGGGAWFLGFPDKVCALKNTPVWAFHGSDDDTVLLKESQVMVDALRACGGDVRFTVYPGVGHDSWTRTYSDPDLYAWLLRQERHR